MKAKEQITILHDTGKSPVESAQGVLCIVLGDEKSYKQFI